MKGEILIATSGPYVYKYRKDTFTDTHIHTRARTHVRTHTTRVSGDSLLSLQSTLMHAVPFGGVLLKKKHGCSSGN